MCSFGSMISDRAGLVRRESGRNDVRLTRGGIARVGQPGKDGDHLVGSGNGFCVSWPG
jgi:hypothetical protein